MTKKTTLETLDKKIDKVSDFVEALAVSVKHGFDETAKKSDLEETNRRLGRIEASISGYDNRLDRFVDDMRLVKTKVGLR